MINAPPPPSSWNSSQQHRFSYDSPAAADRLSQDLGRMSFDAGSAGSGPARVAPQTANPFTSSFFAAGAPTGMTAAERLSGPNPVGERRPLTLPPLPTVRTSSAARSPSKLLSGRVGLLLWWCRCASDCGRKSCVAEWLGQYDAVLRAHFSPMAWLVAYVPPLASMLQAWKRRMLRQPTSSCLAAQYCSACSSDADPRACFAPVASLSSPVLFSFSDAYTYTRLTHHSPFVISGTSFFFKLYDVWLAAGAQLISHLRPPAARLSS